MPTNKVLFLSVDHLRDNTVINKNVDSELLEPFILLAQNIRIEQTIGTLLYNEIVTQIQGDSLSVLNKTLVDDYIQDALVHWAFYECLPFLRYKVMNNNVVSKTAENSTPLSREEAQDLREEIRNTAEFYTERLIDYIKNNTASFTEYTTNTGSDVTPDTVNYYSGMNLEYDRNQRRDITLDDFLTPDLK